MPSSALFVGKVVHVSIPPELADEKALMSYLGASPQELRKIRYYRNRMYRQFEIAKRSGKTRKISAPDNRLKYFQRKIAAVMNKIYRVRNPVHGFVKAKSVKTNAQSHLKRRFVLNIDLQDFFPSITERRILGLLTSIGLEDQVSRLLSTLVCNAGFLPQGAPTSPVLSNMICLRLDRELQQFAKSVRSVYTRYADDITFSSHQPMHAFFEGAVPPAAGRLKPDLLSATLRNIFARNGFQANGEKLHYADQFSRRSVTGLKVNELLNVDRRYVRNIRAAIYYAESRGLKAAQEKFKSSHGGKCDIRSHLAGKISWLGFVRGQSDPVYRAISVRYNRTFPDRKLKVAPAREEIRDRAIWVVEHMSDDTAHMYQGTAFFLKGVGLITAEHCIRNATKIEVYHPSKPANKFEVAVLKSDPHRDLAILAHVIPDTEYFELMLSPKPADVGLVVTGCGYPGFGPGDRLNVREGKISSLAVKSAVKLIDVTQKLPQGMSGGPLMNAEDEVVGVIHKGGPNEARDYAISICALKEWLDEWRLDS